MKKKTLALIIAITSVFSFTGCEKLWEDEASKKDSESSSEKENLSSSSDFSDKYEPVDIDDVIEHVEEIIDASEQSGNSAELEEGINTILHDLDAASEALSYITLDYYRDWYDDDLEEEYDSCYETFWLTHELAAYAFANCYSQPEYTSLFAPYIYDEESAEYYSDNALSIKRLMGYSKVDFDLMDEYLDEYYEIAFNSSRNDNIKNTGCARVYLDILSTYDTEMFYETFNRDFTPDEILALSEIVKSELIPLKDSILDTLEDIPGYEDFLEEESEFDNPFETINEYASKLSPDIADSAKNLVDNELYLMTKGDDCYTGSFTIDLPLENSGLIYTYQYDDYYDLTTAIHEFGHFHASLFDTTPTYLMANNIDLAEVQSQGMEMIFMPLFDELYGENADTMRLIKLYDMLDSVISGFLVGEFEYTVLRDINNMTPEKVVETFNSIMSDYSDEINFYYISHMFEQPGYYISYGVSALAAFDIWEKSITDNAAAVNMYEAIAHMSCNAEETKFSSALAECGFDNVLTEDYIVSLADAIQNYADSIG